MFKRNNLKSSFQYCAASRMVFWWFDLITQFLPHLKNRKDALVINVSSSAALIPFPLSPVYIAAKAALHSFTESLRVQMAFTGVTVIELIPPPVATPLYRDEALAREMKLPKGMDGGCSPRKPLPASKLESWKSVQALLT